MNQTIEKRRQNTRLNRATWDLWNDRIKAKHKDKEYCLLILVSLSLIIWVVCICSFFKSSFNYHAQRSLIWLYVFAVGVPMILWYPFICVFTLRLRQILFIHWQLLYLSESTSTWQDWKHWVRRHPNWPNPDREHNIITSICISYLANVVIRPNTIILFGAFSILVFTQENWKY